MARSPPFAEHGSAGIDNVRKGESPYMTVQNQNVKNVYRGNGSTTVFPFTFAINESHPEYIHVYITNDGGKAAETTDFTCDMETRTITYPKVSSSAPKLSATQRLTIYRLLPYEQNLNLVNQGPFFSEDVETQLDDLEMQIQQLSENLVRCFQIGIEAQDFDMTMELEPGKVICVNSDGNGFEAREAMMEVNGHWDGEGRRIESVADPTATQDAVTKKYVDTLTDNNFMKLQPDGTAWEGRNLPISNVAGPALVKDAANKDYVDRILAGYAGQGERLAIFDNVAQMQAAELVPSQMAVTLGYYDVNDGGAGVYTIRDIGADTQDGGSIIEITGTDYVAELIPDGGVVNVKQFGAYGDDSHDDTTAIQNALDSKFKKIVLPKGVYVISSTIYIPGNKIFEGVQIKQGGDQNVALKTTEDITLLKFRGNGACVAYITLEHEATNMMPVVDITGYRYLKLVGIHCWHGTTSCPAIGLYQSDSSIFSAYDEFRDCSFSGYSENVHLGHINLAAFYNCMLNTGTTRNVYLAGEIISFYNCDISGAVLAIEYHGQYIVRLEGCYLEPLWYGENSNLRMPFKVVDSNSEGAAGIETKGCKIWGGIVVVPDGVYHRPNLVNHFCDGYHSSVNLIKNSNFRFNDFGWLYTSNRTFSQITTDLPKGFNVGGSFSIGDNTASSSIKQVLGHLPKGDYTLALWMKVSNVPSSGNYGDIYVRDEQGSNVKRYTLPVDKLKSIEDSWTYFQIHFNIDDVSSAYNLEINLFGLRAGTISLTGVGVYQGVYTENSNGNSCSEAQVLTDKLLIRGADSKIYQISVNAGTITATEVTS